MEKLQRFAFPVIVVYLGAMMILLGAVVVGWRIRQARWWIAASLLLIVADGIVSILFMWPRNEVMFVEGAAVHSAETLRQTAQEFQTLHWAQLTSTAVSATAIFVGFVAFYPQRVLAEAADATPRETISEDRAADILSREASLRPAPVSSCRQDRCAVRRGGSASARDAHRFIARQASAFTMCAAGRGSPSGNARPWNPSPAARGWTRRDERS